MLFKCYEIRNVPLLQILKAARPARFNRALVVFRNGLRKAKEKTLKGVQ